MQIYSRYLSFAILVLLVAMIALYGKEDWREKVRYYGTAFYEGMVGGFIVDLIGISVGFYYFPRQPFLGFDYFVIVIPCWGVFGLLLNALWRWLGKERFWRGMAITLPILFSYYEGSNLITHSWVYTTPFYAVILGWVPLIWTFVGCNRRRRVVFKMDAWRLQYRSNRLIWGVLTTGRVFVTIAMFPLLVMALVRLAIDLRMLLKHKINVWAYARCLLAM